MDQGFRVCLFTSGFWCTFTLKFLLNTIKLVPSENFGLKYRNI